MLKNAEAGYRTIEVRPEPSGFGAEIVGVDLSRPLDGDALAEVKAAWARHAVVVFPDQPLTLDQLEAFTQQIGPFGEDPYVKPMPGHPNVLEVRREPDEKVAQFGANWHSDWSFLPRPPAATILRAEVVPPVGGDTLFCDCTRAYEALSERMKDVVGQLRAIHTAGPAYGTKGVFAREAAGARSMQIVSSPEAEKTQSHPMVRTHPVTGRKSLFISPVYTWGVEGMEYDRARELLDQLFSHMVQPQFVYRHRWRAGMVLMWDNRCTMHYALGGYDGHLRVMHRTTVAGEAPV